MIDITLEELNITFPCWTLRDVKRYLLNRSEDDSSEDAVNKIFKYMIPSVDISNYNINDKKYLLLITRSMIIGDTVDGIEYSCPHCGKPTQGFYNITDSLTYNKGTNKTISFNGKNIVIIPIKSNDIIDSIGNVDGFTDKAHITEFMDELSITDMNKLIRIISDNINTNKATFTFTPTVTCLVCQKSTIFSSSTEKIIEIVTNIDLADIYKLEVEMKINVGFSIEETLNMLPFERDVYISTINKLRGE